MDKKMTISLPCPSCMEKLAENSAAIETGTPAIFCDEHQVALVVLMQEGVAVDWTCFHADSLKAAERHIQLSAMHAKGKAQAEADALVKRARKH